MKAMATVLLLLASFVLGGCAIKLKPEPGGSYAAEKASLTLHSRPEGAYITEKGSGKSVGVAPVTTYYEPEELTKNADQDGCFKVGGFTARWDSKEDWDGQENSATIYDIRFCGPSNGRYSATFSRPYNPFKQMAKSYMIIGKALGEVAVDVAPVVGAAAVVGVAAAAAAPRPPPRSTILLSPPRSTIFCDSKPGLGGRVDTTCY